MPQSDGRPALALPGVDGRRRHPHRRRWRSAAATASRSRPRRPVGSGSPTSELNPLTIDDGRGARRTPARSPSTAGWPKDQHLEVGDALTLLTLAGQADRSTLVGITDVRRHRLARHRAAPSRSTSADAFDWLNNGQQEYESFYLRGDGPRTTLVAEVERGRPRRASRSRPGTSSATTSASASGAIAAALKKALQAFAILALFVGGVRHLQHVQRDRRPAAARARRARRDRRDADDSSSARSRLEGLVLGLLGSVLGVVAGYVLTLAARWRPQGDRRLAARRRHLVEHRPTIVSGILLGTLITVRVGA